MNLEYIADIGIGGIFALLVLQTVLPHITKAMKREKEDSDPVIPGPAAHRSSMNGAQFVPVCSAQDRLTAMELNLDALTTSTSKMAEILAKTDQDGAPLVYGSPARLSNALDKLGATIEALGTKVDHLSAR